MPPAAKRDLAVEISNIRNTFPSVEFSTLKLDVDLYRTGHVIGPLVLSILGIDWIRKATRRLEIIVDRGNIEVRTLAKVCNTSKTKLL
jgi:hypothetical protein